MNDSAIKLDSYIERDVTEPMNGAIVKRNHWWLCVDGDPKRALFYKVSSYKVSFSAPQCNTDKRIVESLNEMENVKATFIAIAYVPSRD